MLSFGSAHKNNKFQVEERKFVSDQYYFEILSEKLIVLKLTLLWTQIEHSGDLYRTLVNIKTNKKSNIMP